MAGGNYRSCDVCGGKAFYDANLNYADPEECNEHKAAYRVAGEPQYTTQELVEKHGQKLDYVGDWAVICGDCAKTHTTQIIPIASA
jgi:hypothetical protein